MTESWLLWLDTARDPFMNMSIDECLLTNINQYAAPLLRIYQWDRPAVSIGFVQSYQAAPQEGYTVVRRPTGGGVVYHDHDLTYTVVIPAEHDICRLDRVDSYKVIHDAVKTALANLGIATGLAATEIPKHVDRAFMQCFTTPTRYDVVGDGRKFAGAAQRRTRDGILHQGSIDLEASGGNHELLRDNLISAIKTGFNVSFTDFSVSPELMEQASAIMTAKYSKDDWNIYKKQL